MLDGSFKKSTFRVLVIRQGELILRFCSRQKFTLPGTKVSPHVVQRRRRCCRCGQKVAKGLRRFPLSDQAEIQVCYKA